MDPTTTTTTPAPTARPATLSERLYASAGSRSPDPCLFLETQCAEGIVYRPIDGSCNNLKQPWLGRANTPVLRVVAPDYSQGGLPRSSLRGRPLPSAQDVVSRLMPQTDHQSYITHLFVIWSQLVSHDFALRAAPKNKAIGPCCGEGAGERCIPIPVSENDPFYRQFNRTCLPMERTNATTCNSSQPEQLSGSTHWIDASFVYGSSEATAQRLRVFRGGLLRVRPTALGDFPPDVANPKAACGQHPCYDTGDPRTNQTPMLAGLQTLWLREHNRVASTLSALNPHWDDETLYQEARRVVVAEWQLITYRDWLPWLLGQDRVRERGLAPTGPCARSEYRADVDPRTANDVTTAGYRAIHSMVQGTFWLGERGERTGRISQWLQNPGPVLEREDGLLDVLQGMAFQQAQDLDRYMDNELTQQYEPTREPDGRQWGHNLVAVDIQRGRDHGLPGYVEYRKYVGLPDAEDFDDLSDTLHQKDIDVLKELYEDVEDVDYYVGGLLERRKAPLFGPTFQALLEDQFWRWRFADRFFFNFVGFPHSFTKDQIRAIEGASVARLFCDNVEGFRFVPRDPFVKTNYNGNEETPCDSLPRVDLSSWKEDSHDFMHSLISFPKY
ncbi:peroxidase-like [Thrips palmi]|uniref:Peroxidase-like n=1 Tax=Thrips palmi TaxID=161013 RepID=A0A6P8Y9R4_THRPL|nr:peroxidase-like [Thrips palmi]